MKLLLFKKKKKPGEHCASQWDSRTKCPRPAAYAQTLTPHRAGGRKFKVKASADYSASGEGLLPGLQTATLSLCPRMAKRERAPVSSSPHEDPNPATGLHPRDLI